MTWYLVGLLASGSLWLLWSARWVRPEEDLGSVSSEWLAEYRQDGES
jgi:hypothetical protein